MTLKMCLFPGNKPVFYLNRKRYGDLITICLPLTCQYNTISFGAIILPSIVRSFRWREGVGEVKVFGLGGGGRKASIQTYQIACSLLRNSIFLESLSRLSLKRDPSVILKLFTRWISSLTFLVLLFKLISL